MMLLQTGQEAPAAKPEPDGAAAWAFRADETLPGRRPTVQLKGNAEDVRIETRAGVVVYRPEHVARGAFEVAATLEVLKLADHAEGYGVFLGGESVDRADARYLYLLLGTDGRWTLRYRDGSRTAVIVPWTEATAILPTPPMGGSPANRLVVRVREDGITLAVNERTVASIARSLLLGASTDGAVGLRLNHHMTVRARDLTIR
ncbi:MAG: hypothetical protein K2X99_05650, partial [Gemmatimonadaceae bacterium]|nr:hypothetical protein [Gemmatimonadaceae bacterium]